MWHSWTYFWRCLYKSLWFYRTQVHESSQNWDPWHLCREIVFRGCRLVACSKPSFRNLNFGYCRSGPLTSYTTQNAWLQHLHLFLPGRKRTSYANGTIFLPTWLASSSAYIIPGMLYVPRKANPTSLLLSNPRVPSRRQNSILWADLVWYTWLWVATDVASCEVALATPISFSTHCPAMFWAPCRIFQSILQEGSTDTLCCLFSLLDPFSSEKLKL